MQFFQVSVACVKMALKVRCTRHCMFVRILSVCVLIYVFCTIWMIEKTLVCVCVFVRADVGIGVGKFGCSCHGGTSLNATDRRQ